VLADGPTTYAGLEAALEAGLVDKVGFTGSTAVGRRIGELCGRFLQSPCLELGGKNPMLVMADADLDLAVEGALFSGFGTAGQRCTSLGTVWVQEPVYDEFRARFLPAVEDAVVGDPREAVLFGPMISERYLDNHLANLELVQDHHALHGSTGIGRITSANPRKGFVGDPDLGVFAHPTVVEGVRPGDALYAQETFGPLVGMGSFGSLDEGIGLANGHGYGLSSSVYTTDPATVWRFRAGISAGMVSVNNSTSGAEAHLPFGGNGRSGNGSRQSGIWVLDQVTRWQALNWDWSGRLQKAQMDVEAPMWDPGFRLPDGSGAR
jgi:aldehyde dehydrogenase (NAD+)